MSDLQHALKLLPHGPEFRFIDRLLSLTPGVCGAAEYYVNARAFEVPAGVASRFPNVLLIEAGAQLAGVVAQNDPSIPPLPGLKLTALRSVTVLGPARAGDTIRIEASVTGRLGHLVQARASAFLGSRQLMSAEFTLSGTAGSLPTRPRVSEPAV